MVGTGNGLAKVYYDPVKSQRYVIVINSWELLIPLDLADSVIILGDEKKIFNSVCFAEFYLLSHSKEEKKSKNLLFNSCSFSSRILVMLYGDSSTWIYKHMCFEMAWNLL